tara:strand:+ start:1099 stop:1305 length:207 start_codon:yes stop_codon:yes gene_type:complete
MRRKKRKTPTCDHGYTWKATRDKDGQVTKRERLCNYCREHVEWIGGVETVLDAGQIEFIDGVQVTGKL